jgi:hypothetical protein
MNDPLKIIFKYKNNVKKVQYHTYIFIGSLVPKNVSNILDKIKDKNLIDSLLLLTKEEQSIIVKEYGDYWYEKFFNNYHINHIKKQVIQSAVLKKKIIDKYGNNWYEFHFIERDLTSTKVTYSYDANIKKIYESRKSIGDDDEDKIDYTTSKNITRLITIQRLSNNNNNVSNIKNEAFDYNRVTNKTIYNENVFFNRKKNRFEPMIGGEEPEPELNDIDIKEIEDIYKEADVDFDKNTSKTKEMIKNVIQKTKIFNSMYDFDKSKDNNQYNEQLKDVYSKVYITTIYIYKDDTIKMIKNKICCSIKNHDKFNNSYILPSRQYLWSEYYYEKKLNKVMIGHKWLRYNELLNIDIEPNNNLRFYEKVRGNLNYLKNNIRRYGSKIKKEDDEFNILYYYDNYITTNDIYMIDIYNELGLNYKKEQEELDNLMDVYIKVYFPKLNRLEMINIINLLNNRDVSTEKLHVKTTYDTLNNDIILTNEITNTVEKIKIKEKNYKNVFKKNFITQSAIHVILNFNSKNNKKIINLHRIFDNFIVNDDMPFIQYQTNDGNINFKFDKKYKQDSNQLELLSKWFENAPYGISFKLKIKERGYIKYMTINLKENGRIEYKIQWKEEYEATIDDIINTYDYIKRLIRKINEENNYLKIDIPKNDDFNFAFINSIQKFIIPEKYVINHNDLSEFSRYFFPYVSLIIEPRKRIGKIKKETKSKFGTYLRYKRISQYEDKKRLEYRILYYMKNYDYTITSLSNEVAKQFNLTIEQATKEVNKMHDEYPNIKKSTKVLKKLENVPKYKIPGVQIDIQGKVKEKYKIKISGARNKNQLNRIITFMNILMYLYIETYLYKKQDKQKFKDKLKKLTKIASRRNKVDEIVNYQDDKLYVKQIASIDKNRLGFKPKKGQNQWSRLCQNSGDDKKRQPQQYTDKTINKLISKGYKLNKKTGQYEKEITITKDGKRKKVLLRTIKLKNSDGSNVYYGCSKEDNGEHMHVGVLSKSSNPHGICMPCCFKKDTLLSNNKDKKEYYLECIGLLEKKEESDVVGDLEKLYILQDTNKIQDGRYGLLPKYLDIFLNKILNKSYIIKNHYLLQTDGYYFKYGILSDKNKYLKCISVIFDLNLNDLKNKLILSLKRDKNDLMFTSLNNGNIRTIFETRKKYIDFIEKNNDINNVLLNDLICYKGVLYKDGINIFIFEKKIIKIVSQIEKDIIKEDFVINCINLENIDFLFDQTRQNILIYKDNDMYYPIVYLNKKNPNTKDISFQKLFTYEKSEQNIVEHIYDYYKLNCKQDNFNKLFIDNNIIAKYVYKILVGLNDKDYYPKYQIIDNKYKCIFICVNNGLNIPVKPSGIIHDLEIRELELDTFNNTIDKLDKLYKISNKQLKVKPMGVNVENKKIENIIITSIITINNYIVPIKPFNYSKKKIIENDYVIQTKSLNLEIDNVILQNKKTIDNRILQLNKDNYLNESYQLFRLELSNYILQNENIKNKLNKIVNSKGENKLIEIRRILYKISDIELYDVFNENYQVGGKENFINIIDEMPNLDEYEINNHRKICYSNLTKDKCNKNIHCNWDNVQCKFSLTREMLIKFINKVSHEIVDNDFNKKEIFREKQYFVSDIVDLNRFIERPNQKIIKSNNINIKNQLEELFGVSNIPIIGKRRRAKKNKVNIEDLNKINALKELDNYYVQNIINNNNSLYRAFANGLFWNKNKLYDIKYKNLGYYSDLQTDLSNYFKGIIVDWLNNKSNINKIKDLLIKYNIKNINKFIIKISNDISTLSNGIFEYLILSKIYKIKITIYDQNNNILTLLNNGAITSDKTIDKDNSIHIRFNYFSKKEYPDSIDVLYYK